MTTNARTLATFRKMASDQGTWWTGNGITPEQLRDVCLRFDPARAKQASIGGEQEQGFEQAFSSLAYAYLKDKAPRLLDFIVGFQLVDRNEDNTKAVGVFGFKVGKQWLYAPVFFLNGDLKGHELLYIKNQDSFVPMKENWVNYIMSRKPHVLGEGSKKDVYQLGGLAPNIERLSWPPAQSKYGGVFDTPNIQPFGSTPQGGAPAATPPIQPSAAAVPAPAVPPVPQQSAFAEPPMVSPFGSAPQGGMPAAPAAPAPMAAPVPAAPAAPAAPIQKAGYVRPLHVDAWARPLYPMLAAAATKQARFLYRGQQPGRGLDMAKVAAAPFVAALAEVAELFDMEKVLGGDIRMAKLAWDVYNRYPGVKLAFDRIYGPGFFLKTVGGYKAAADAACRSIMPKPASPAPAAPKSSLGASIMPKMPVAKIASADSKVDIVTDADVGIKKNLPDLDDEDKKRILNHGYLVRDERTGEEVTKAYNTQVRQELTNPHESGLYEVLEAPGSFEKMLIITHPEANDGGQDFCTVIRLEGSPKAWINAHTTAIFARQSQIQKDGVELAEDFRTWFDKLSDSKSLDNGATYVAVSATGQGTCPFEVREDYSDGDYKAYKVNFDASMDYRRGRRATGLPKTVADGPSANSDYEEHVSHYGALLVCNQRKETKLRAVNGELHVPTDSFKFLKLKDPPKPKKNDSDSILKACEPECGGGGSEEPRPITPGNISDIQLLFTQKTAQLRIYADNSEVTLRTEQRGYERLPSKQALFCLIRSHGLTEKAAAEVISTAQRKGGGIWRLAYGEGYPLKQAYTPNANLLDGGPSSPMQPPPEFGTEPVGYQNVRSVYPQEERVPVPGLEASRTDPRIYDPFLNITPDQSATAVAQQAGQEGQKEVFDTTMLAGMLKAVRQDAIVDRYLGDLMKAVDKLGRILFMFFWHGEEFEDRYGKGDLPELEDSLRNAFESLGDVVLFLKEKTIEPGLDEISDPSIEEAARN